jgi:hypothetical protein
MTSWNPQANELFLKALELGSADERREYLDDACGGDAGRGVAAARREPFAAAQKVAARQRRCREPAAEGLMPWPAGHGPAGTR